MIRENEIKKRLTDGFHPTVLEITDDSSKHAGHAAMKGLDASETHFTVQIVSAAFAGKSRLERHRMVNESLADLFDQGLHALAINATAPD